MKYILVCFCTAVVVFAGVGSFRALRAPIAPPGRVFMELIPTAKGFDVRVPEGVEMGEVAKLFVEALKAEGRVACKK